MTDNTEDPIIQGFLAAMAVAQYPDYFLPEQFCDKGAVNIDYIIPPTSTTNTAIPSLDTGAPPLQQVKPNLGGAVFERAQYNGILRMLSNILAFMNKGGQFTYNTANTAGYKLDAVLFDYATGRFVISKKDNNTANFVTDPSKINGTDWAFITTNLNDILSSNNTWTGQNTFNAAVILAAATTAAGITNGNINALKTITNFGSLTNYGAITISTNGAQVPQAFLNIVGNGNSDKYGVILTTPNGIWAPNGTTNLGAIGAVSVSTSASIGATLDLTAGRNGSVAGSFWVGGALTKGQGIIDTGNNANGTWVKYNNGIIECWGNVLGQVTGSNFTIQIPMPISITNFQSQPLSKSMVIAIPSNSYGFIITGGFMWDWNSSTALFYTNATRTYASNVQFFARFMP